MDEKIYKQIWVKVPRRVSTNMNEIFYMKLRKFQVEGILGNL